MRLRRHSFLKFNEKNLPASLANLNAPRARDPTVALRARKYLVVALYVPFYLDLVLRLRSYILCIRLNLFTVI